LTNSAELSRDVTAILIIVLCCLLLFFYKLGDRPLWDYDEAMHAQVAKEMLQRGDWCTPVFNGESFYNKPVMHFWMVMISFMLFGISEFSARLPSTAIGIAGVFLVYFWGRYAFGRLTGILSSLILATSVEYIILSQNIIHDMTLCFFINLALFQFHKAVKVDVIPYSSIILIAASMGCAVLTKGPIGLLLTSAVIFVFILITKRWSLVFNRRLFLGIIVFLLVALPWFVLMALRHEDYLKTFLLEGNLGRFFSGEAPHKEPVYYYLLVLAVGFFPWSAFLPSALYSQTKDYLRGKSSDVLFLLLSAGVPFVFFSLSRSKLATYILLVFPALSILMGRFWAGISEKDAPAYLKSHFRYSSRVFFLIILIVAAGGLLYTNKAYPQYVFNALMACLFLVFCGLVYILSSFSKKIMVSFTVMVLFMITAIMGINRFVLPAFSQYKSMPQLAATLKILLPPGAPIYFYRDLRESAIFYTGRRGFIIRKPEEFESFLNTPETVFCVIHIKQYKKLKPLLRASMYPVVTEGKHMLISNKDPLHENTGAVT